MLSSTFETLFCIARLHPIRSLLKRVREAIGIATVNDGVYSEQRDVDLTASAPNFASVMRSLAIVGDEVVDVNISLSTDTVGEPSGTVLGYVDPLFPLAFDLEVLLTSADSSEATVPSSIIVPAGQIECHS